MAKPLKIATAMLLTLISGSAAQAGGGGVVDAVAGKALAQQLCARCHAIESTGDSPFTPAPPFRTIPQRYDLANLEEALAEGIAVGHEAMPEFELSPEQIDDFLAYLRSLN